MNGWIDQITAIVQRAAKDESLPEVPAMFEGDSWIWTWRQWGDYVAETVVKVRPDAFGEGFEIVVSAGAWMQARRHVSASRTYYTRYIELKQMPDIQETLTSELEHALRQAWRGANDMAPRLREVEHASVELMDKLRAMDLLK